MIGNCVFWNKPQKSVPSWELRSVHPVNVLFYNFEIAVENAKFISFFLIHISHTYVTKTIKYVGRGHYVMAILLRSSLYIIHYLFNGIYGPHTEYVYGSQMLHHVYPKFLYQKSSKLVCNCAKN